MCVRFFGIWVSIASGTYSPANPSLGNPSLGRSFLATLRVAILELGIPGLGLPILGPPCRLGEKIPNNRLPEKPYLECKIWRLSLFSKTFSPINTYLERESKCYARSKNRLFLRWHVCHHIGSQMVILATIFKRSNAGHYSLFHLRPDILLLNLLRLAYEYLSL